MPKWLLGNNFIDCISSAACWSGFIFLSIHWFFVFLIITVINWTYIPPLEINHGSKTHSIPLEGCSDLFCFHAASSNRPVVDRPTQRTYQLRFRDHQHAIRNGDLRCIDRWNHFVSDLGISVWPLCPVQAISTDFLHLGIDNLDECHRPYVWWLCRDSSIYGNRWISLSWPVFADRWLFRTWKTQ